MWMQKEKLKSMKGSPLLLRSVRQDHLLSQGKTAITGILQYKTVILVLVNADFIAKNVCTESWKTACTHMCMCGIEYMSIEKSRRESEFSPACRVARVGKVGPLPQMSRGTAAKAYQDRDMVGCHLRLSCPDWRWRGSAVRSQGSPVLCTYACTHTHIYKNKHTHIQCMPSLVQVTS